jgi:hypothetical protein
MAASAPTRSWSRAVLGAAALVLIAGESPAQILPWEMTVAEIEAGRLRGLVERLAKQNLLYQLHLGDITKNDLVETASRIDLTLRSLESGNPSYSVPRPWTTALTESVSAVDQHWGPLRRIAVASPYDALRVSNEFVPPDRRRGDPLLLLYFDDMSEALIAKSEALLDLYHAECLQTGLEVCTTAHSSGYAAMLIERAAKQAVYVFAGIRVGENRERLKETVEAFKQHRADNQKSNFFAAALDPKRGSSAKAAAELLASLRNDWDSMQAEFVILSAGDVKNFDLQRLLGVQSQLVEKVERMTAALVRYASLEYGS